ncbi:hypothetical protein E2C01_047719 [Portunus trituberculatus]|uniref:Uncharacterized protein n=1 Tax=Portunus trituberculatus TaxID=210409 RepID=A0A5B7G9L0_PORTR|nr:hypothetical protein [Portunus trituberculatus]
MQASGEARAEDGGTDKGGVREEAGGRWCGREPCEGCRKGQGKEEDEDEKDEEEEENEDAEGVGGIVVTGNDRVVLEGKIVVMGEEEEEEEEEA